MSAINLPSLLGIAVLGILGASVYAHNYTACPPGILGLSIPIPHPFSCSKYYYCTLGSLVEFTCPAGFNFDQRTRTCTDIGLADCYHPTPIPVPTTESWNTTTRNPWTTHLWPTTRPVPRTTTTYVCGEQKLTGPTNGAFASPGYPGPYSGNLDCYYRISARNGSRVTLHVDYLQVESSPGGCQYDYVAVYDVNNGSTLLAKLCGNAPVNNIFASSNEVLVRFHTDSSVQFSGFSISYYASDIGCGQLDYAGISSADIISPGYPSRNYPNNVVCFYFISTPSSSGSRIDFKFNYISLESGDTNCYYDLVRFYDEQNLNSTTIGIICSSTGDIIQSSTNEALVTFKSDTSRTGRGFNLTFTETFVWNNTDLNTPN